MVQIQRTIPSGQYGNSRAAVGGQPYDIASGERSVFDQYCLAIRSARQTIYLENQYLEVLEIVEELHGALQRGVEAVLLMPTVPDLSPSAYASPERRAFFERRAALGQYEHFTLAGIAGLGTDGFRKPVYVHSKLMLVDDAWATIGSANLHRASLFGNAELNAAISSPETVRVFRVALFEEHLGVDTSGLNALEAHRLFGQVARANRQRFSEGSHNWQGLALSLDIGGYGQAPQMGS